MFRNVCKLNWLRIPLNLIPGMNTRNSIIRLNSPARRIHLDSSIDVKFPHKMPRTTKNVNVLAWVTCSWGIPWFFRYTKPTVLNAWNTFAANAFTASSFTLGWLACSMLMALKSTNGIPETISTILPAQLSCQTWKIQTTKFARLARGTFCKSGFREKTGTK